MAKAAHAQPLECLTQVVTIVLSGKMARGRAAAFLELSQRERWGNVGFIATHMATDSYVMVTDGSVHWGNVSALQYLPPGGMSVSKISGGTVHDNGINEPAGFVSDNIRIEGAAASARDSVCGDRYPHPELPRDGYKWCPVARRSLGWC